MLLLGYYFLGRVLSNYELFYYQASEVLYSLEALFFAFYCWTDVNKFKWFYKACYAGILSLFFINFFSAINICSLKFHNSEKTAVEIDEILATNYINYITELSKPFLIFGIVVGVIYFTKIKNNKDE